MGGVDAASGTRRLLTGDAQGVALEPMPWRPLAPIAVPWFIVDLARILVEGRRQQGC
jgi:hypothetical protein